MPARGGASSRDGHPGWCQFDFPADLCGTEHVSRPRQWRFSYQHEVAILGWVRHIAYPDGRSETPAAVVSIDNAAVPGEIAMSVDDLTTLINRLHSLRTALLTVTDPDRHRQERAPGSV